jgi:hypothetical protein
MREHENKIKDLRVLEAKKRDYMGLKGKFGAILKTMGEPIIEHSEGLYSQNVMEDYMDIEESEDLPTADTEDRDQPEGWEWKPSKEIDLFQPINQGWHFDALSRGLQLEIWFTEEESELKVTYKGYVVYKEQGGDLKSFVPHEEWQQPIESLYLQARKLLRKQQDQQNKSKASKEKTIKGTWIDRMKSLWGA